MINVRSNETCYTQITERIKVLILIEKYSHLVFDREETCGGSKTTMLLEGNQIIRTQNLTHSMYTWFLDQSERI